MKAIDLHIPYKGTRDYLKGEDKYKAIVRFIKSNYPQLSEGELKIVFHRYTINQCRLICPEPHESSQRPDDFVDEFICSLEGDRVIGWITETENPVTERIPYPEELIFEKCLIKDQKISLSGAESGFTSMETLVSMTKKLHLDLFPDKEKKWIVTKVELHRFLKPGDTSKLRVEFRKNFKNRLTRSAIFSGEEPLGDIYYSLD
jgi:hypothetical protein